VRGDPPTEDDFLSHEAQGRRQPDDSPETLRLWSGISVYATEEQARRRARTAPMLGTYLAELRFADDGAIRWERTPRRGHHTLWAPPALLLAAVTLVVPIEGSEQSEA
jgi:hypothetical protein